MMTHGGADARKQSGESRPVHARRGRLTLACGKSTHDDSLRALDVASRGPRMPVEDCSRSRSRVARALIRQRGLVPRGGRDSALPAGCPLRRDVDLFADDALDEEIARQVRIGV